MGPREANAILECMAIDMAEAMSGLTETMPLKDVVRQRLNAIKVAQSALRPVSREQVEKVWRGECDCSKPKACCTCCSMRCQYCIGQSEYRQAAFCMKCGRPMTDEAVRMVMERWKEAMDGEDD